MVPELEGRGKLSFLLTFPTCSIMFNCPSEAWPVPCTSVLPGSPLLVCAQESEFKSSNGWVRGWSSSLESR